MSEENEDKKRWLLTFGKYNLKKEEKKKNMFLVIYNEFHFKTAELLPKMETTSYYIIIKMHEDFFFL